MSTDGCLPSCLVMWNLSDKSLSFEEDASSSKELPENDYYEKNGC